MNNNWFLVVVVVGFVTFGVVSMGVLIALPTKWHHATVLRICRDGTPILELADGSVWARRSGFVAYRVERKPEEVCG